jgi:hypothetical protein
MSFTRLVSKSFTTRHEHRDGNFFVMQEPANKTISLSLQDLSLERLATFFTGIAALCHISDQGRLSTHYSFTKPNDSRALSLMNAAASAVVSNIPDLCIAYGVSDEYSFVFHKSTELFERRAAKLVSTIASTFTAFYVHLWSKFMAGVELESSWLPTFDGRAVCFPSLGNLRDYLSWRQVDCRFAVEWNLVGVYTNRHWQVTSITSTTQHSGQWFRRVCLTRRQQKRS